MLLREVQCGRNFSGRASSAQSEDCLVSFVLAVGSSCLDLYLFSRLWTPWEALPVKRYQTPGRDTSH